MFLVKFTEEQVKFLFTLLDSELKRNGLNSLQSVVDLQNALAVAQVLERVAQPSENTETNLSGV